MRKLILLSSLCFFLACTKTGSPDDNTPAASEKKIIDAATAFFKSSGTGEYNQIVNNYRVALGPVLDVRRVLAEGPCSADIFQNNCCCPFHFSMNPYDDVNGNAANYHYPKSALFTARQGKMEGNFTASFESKPLASSITKVQYSDFVLNSAVSINLTGTVDVKDVWVSPVSGNALYTAQFSDNSFSISSGKVISLAGQLTFTDGDASGNLTLDYPDGHKVITEFTVSSTPPGSSAAFLSKARFVMDGVETHIDFGNKTILINDRTFKLDL